MTKRNTEGNYFTYKRYVEIIESETNPMYRLIFRFLYEKMLRVGECIGDSTRRFCSVCDLVIRIHPLSPNPMLHRLKKHCSCDNPVVVWRNTLPGLSKDCIDAVNSHEYNIISPHNLKILGKGGSFAIIDLPDVSLANSNIGGLYTELQSFLNGKHLTQSDRIFPITRLSVYNRIKNTVFVSMVSI